MKRQIRICAVIVLFSMGYSRGGMWTTLDYPGASDTSAFGIRGNKVVGAYNQPPGSWHGFLYDGITWSGFNAPGAILPAGDQTVATGISGSNLVGYYSSHGRWYGFLYDGTTWTSLDSPYPGTNYTFAYGIERSNVVGSYQTSSSKSGFLYDLTTGTWTNLNYYGYGTEIRGICGSNLVGYYWNAGYHGFLYNMTSGIWSTLDRAPGVTTFAYGIDGDNVVGRYFTGSFDHGFLYSMTSGTWTDLDYPGAITTSIYGISGSNLVGEWVDAYHRDHGFICTIPEPTVIPIPGAVLLGSIGLSFSGWLLRRRRTL